MKLKRMLAMTCALFPACDGIETGDAVAHATSAGSNGQVCTVSAASTPLPEEVRETSGLAAGGSGLLWTHNDAGNPAELFALDAAGRLVQRVRVAGAGSVDWEDIEAAPCGDDNCLFIGDIGDNEGGRTHVTIYVIPEPDRSATTSAQATALHARYPGGPRDAEGLFVAPGGDIYIVSKGRSEAVELFRYAQPYRAGEAVTLERVRELFQQPRSGDERVSAATMSKDGVWVAIRSYRTLFLYRAEQLLDRSATADPLVIDLRPLGHRQGESVAIGTDGTVWLTSEAENRGSLPVWGRLACTFRAPARRRRRSGCHPRWEPQQASGAERRRLRRT